MGNNTTKLTTKIAKTETDRVTIRGLDLVDEIIGKLSFVEMVYFLCSGERPSAAQARVLDACLVTLMEHGWTPSSIVTRLMIDSVPEESQVAIASGLLSLGSVFAGTSEGCAKLLELAVQSGKPLQPHFAEVVSAHRSIGQTIPGFGHPQHKPDDPRSGKLLDIARAAGFDGAYVAALRELGRAVDAAAGKHITINATGVIGALLLEIGLSTGVMRGLAVVSRSAGLIGHVVEERETHSARHIWRLAEEHVPYKP
jgi:citrate synthase